MTTSYFSVKSNQSTPRLPLVGNIDLTYRCNNACRHCWLWIPANAQEQRNELSFDEIRLIVSDACAMGTREWHISGGEPMLRPDFSEIFDYITRKANTYSLNTNGTLITAEIAKLLKRKGKKLVALYGATADTYDQITRNPGGFELAMRGFQLMQANGVGFTVQLIPLRGNWHEWEQMQELARSLSQHWRVGASWLYMSAYGNPLRNVEIAKQRLDPRIVVELDSPDMSKEREESSEFHRVVIDDRLFNGCIYGRRDFHLDPYGGMTFCSFLKDPTMRYNLRTGYFQEAWEQFIPSLAEKVHGGVEYSRNCYMCENRGDCRWCPVYGYLEHGRFAAPVEYLCEIAKENRKFKEGRIRNHRRFYRIAEITIQVDSDLPISDTTFSKEIELFRVEGPGDDTVTIHHHFELLDLKSHDLGKEVYRKTPWAIYHHEKSWVYLSFSEQESNQTIHKIATFNHDHRRGQVFNDGKDIYLKGNSSSLTTFSSDQILVARLLADRNGCYIHSAGAIINGAGVLFVGHSETGKSTITRLLIDVRDGVITREGMQSSVNELKIGSSHIVPEFLWEKVPNTKTDMSIEILCDDRNIVRHWGNHWRIYGTWSHGDVPDVSPASAPLQVLCFLEQANQNLLTHLIDHKEIIHRLLPCVIRPFVTTDWWQKTLGIIEKIASEVPCYVMQFDKSGEIIDELNRLIITKK